MARTAEITFKEFRRRYNTEDACRAELFRLRFPNGFVCPKCGCVEYYPVHGRNIYQCRSCRHQTSVTAGTVMHRTHLPLTLWFWAIYLCATDKRGISAVQLSRTRGSVMIPRGTYWIEFVPLWVKETKNTCFPAL